MLCIAAFILSHMFLRSCMFIIVTPDHHYESSYRLGLWSYASDREPQTACMPYPPHIEFDTYFLVGRISSSVSTVAGGMIMIITFSMVGLTFHMGGIYVLSCALIICSGVQAMPFLVLLKSNMCTGDNGGGYFRGKSCELDRASRLCLMASLCWFASGFLVAFISPPIRTTATTTLLETTTSSDSGSGKKKQITTQVRTPDGATILAVMEVETKVVRPGVRKTITKAWADLMPA